MIYLIVTIYLTIKLRVKTASSYCDNEPIFMPVLSSSRSVIKTGGLLFKI
ncbi:hypothetical protein [uncultured Clostridium sp.]|nr:hypothetical protein [uncultured Clostridium sp.]